MQQLNELPKCDYDSIGEAIKSIRIFRGLTQVRIAKELKIARQSYLNIENNIRDLKLNRLLEICEILNVPLSYFLSIDEKYILKYISSEALLDEIQRRNLASSSDYIIIKKT
ncbi:helix-turn-helix transcriptional regulator [Photobacterium damselae]|nr:helix-turn-helix transcriptional regulator [Photobacterium damselae]